MDAMPAKGRNAVPRDVLAEALSRFPRVRLARLPTPLVEARRLSAALQGPRIWMKREDLTGLGFGGSKYRILEFTLGRALAAGADVVIAGGVAQSNHPQQAVSAASHLGIPAVALLGGAEGHTGWTGNMLLQGLSGAQVHLLPSAGFEEIRAAQEVLAEQLRGRGHRPAILTMTREVHVCGVLAYVNYMVELAQQMEEEGIQPAALYVASGGPTYAGMALGAMATGAAFDVVGVSPLGAATKCLAQVTGLIEEVAALLKVDVRGQSGRIHITDEYLGAGHGIPTPEAVAAIKLTASTEGVFLDPVYSGKAMAALVDHTRRRRFDRNDTVVFAHTGGGPGLFAYAGELMPEPCSVLETGSLGSIASQGAEQPQV